jgi:chromosomal replication initiator protein
MEARPAQEIWETALGELQLQVTRPNYRTWLEKTTGLSFKDNLFVVGVPNTFVAEYLARNQHSLIEKTLIGLTHPGVEVHFQVNSAHATAAGNSNLPGGNAKYTFDSFVVSESNRLAYAAARSVAEKPGAGYNPLFIYGGVGLGKSHLMHAIYNQAQAENIKALYVSAEQFTNEFVSAIQSRSTGEFRAKYRRVDMLLIDDIQFISGKGQTEESFFHTFNELHDANRQIVLASDRPPKSLPNMGDRLCSRFEWGLVADIQPPDFETRLAILKNKAQQQEVEVALDVLEFIARRIRQNIRELEGSLNRAVAYAKLFGAILTPELAARAVPDITPSSNKTALSPEQVMKIVAERFQLTPDDLTGRKRDRATALARQVAMYLLKEATNCSLAQIGLEFGNRDHATVIHACRKIASDIDNDPRLRRQVLDIQQGLLRQPGARR